jgi:hypothetical protein
MLVQEQRQCYGKCYCKAVAVLEYQHKGRDSANASTQQKRVHITVAETERRQKVNSYV